MNRPPDSPQDTDRLQRTGEASKALFDRLPEYYREHPGIVKSLVDVAEELVGSTRDALQRTETTLVRHGSGLTSRARNTAGTLQHLLTFWSQGEPLSRPAVYWPATAVEVDDGALTVVRRDGNIVIGWPSGDPGMPRDVEVPESETPAGLRVQVIRFSSTPPAVDEPLYGARFQGDVLFDGGVLNGHFVGGDVFDGGDVVEGDVVEDDVVEGDVVEDDVGGGGVVEGDVGGGGVGGGGR